jgi:hypothetical protein
MKSRNNSNSVVDIGRRKGYLVEKKVDYGYGIIDILRERAKPIIYGIRKQWNVPRFRENFELLAEREH